MIKHENIAEDQHKKLINLKSQITHAKGIAVSVDCVIFGFDENKLKVLLIKSDASQFKNMWSLLGDFVGISEDINEAAYRILKSRTGLNDVFLEQFSAFGDVVRHPAGRVITVAYYSLINIQHHQLKIHANELHWHDVNLVHEMAFDHKKIFDTGLAILKKQIQQQPVGFNLLPKKFSLRELQNLYESILEIKLDRRNFRKKFLSTGVLTALNEYEDNVTHRPGKLYAFNDQPSGTADKKWNGIGF